MLKKVLYGIKKNIAKRNRKFVCNYEHNEEISLITCNCIGGLLYSDIGMRFCSPTINLYIESPDFVKFANNLRHYIDSELEFYSCSNYPIGRLDDILIHFLHYDDFDSAKEKWNIRKERIVWDKIFVIMSDRDNFTPDLINDFMKIPYKKIIFSHTKYDLDECVWVEKDKNKKEVDDLTRYYNLSGEKTYEHYFDIERWITGKYKEIECKKIK